MGNFLKNFKGKFQETNEILSVSDYLDLCKKDKLTYANVAERILKAIGEPEYINTKDDPRLSKIFSNRVIKRYPAFKDFYGNEEVVEQIVSYFKHSAQGLEERKQILYLMGPVGGGKSSLAEKIKKLCQKEAIYVLCDSDGKMSPVYENPLGLFSDMSEEEKEAFSEEYEIPLRYLPACASPWAVKRLKEYKGDITKFKVKKVYPSTQNQIAISKTEPGDENNQDISSLVGSTNISKLGQFEQSDPDSYSYTGGLCLGNQGVMEFVEMFKAPIKVLHPLLTATQEKNYNGTEPIGNIPFDGVVIAHSNENEWSKFVNDKKNEAFIDRIYKVQVPYCLRYDDEVKIYEKMLTESSLSEAKVAPQTIDILAKFTVMSRLEVPQNSHLRSKLRVYNGESLKDTDPDAKSLQEYRDIAGINEGMKGISTRFAFKVLSKTFNFDPEEVAANPVHLMLILKKEIQKEQYDNETETHYIDLIKNILSVEYAEFIEKEIQKAYIESYDSYGQNIFERYITFARYWLDDEDYRDPNTGEMFNRDSLHDELQKIERNAHIMNESDFRNEVVRYVLRVQSKNGGEMPKWNSYRKIQDVIENKIFSNTDELLPIISFSTKSNKKDERKHKEFVDRMKKQGYTQKQVRLLVDWFMRMKKNS
jgi:serine protein kinase